MKTVRFAKVVQKAGKPEVYLLWAAPGKDPEFKKALKAERIMTVHQEHGQADYGTVGYKKGSNEQLLVFPKPLKGFEEKRIVGVKYEMVAEKEIPKSQRVKPVTPPKRAKHKLHEPVAENEKEPEAEEEARIEKRRPSKAEGSQISAGVRKQIKKAMRFLKSGKQVQAYEVLQELDEA